jgi:hypothetical protein
MAGLVPAIRVFRSTNLKTRMRETSRMTANNSNRKRKFFDEA